MAAAPTMLMLCARRCVGCGGTRRPAAGQEANYLLISKCCVVWPRRRSGTRLTVVIGGL